MTLPIVVLRPGDGPKIADLKALDSAKECADIWDADLARASLLVLGIESVFGPLIAMIRVSLTPDMADIEDVVVRRDHRRQGLATQLIQAVAKRAGERGIARLTLDVSEKNTGARALYACLGFEDDGRRLGYYSDGSDAILMSRPVTPFTGQAGPHSPSRDP